MSEYHSSTTGLPVVLGHQSGRLSALGGEAARRTTIPTSKPVMVRLFIFSLSFASSDLYSLFSRLLGLCLCLLALRPQGPAGSCASLTGGVAAVGRTRGFPADEPPPGDRGQW